MKKKIRLGVLVIILAGIVVSFGLLVACQTPGRGDTWIPRRVVRTYNTDVLIVGGGGSGLACAVQAAINGTDFILIEKTGLLGGSANKVEGMFAIDSRFQRELGIDIKPVQIVYAELVRKQFRPNGALWVDLSRSSAGNIEWLMQQGVRFSGRVCDLFGSALYPTMHWFEGEVGAIGFTPHMERVLRERNATIHLETRARTLIKENGRIVGVYAETREGAVRYNAKVVVIATGGFGGNPQLIAKQGWDIEGMTLSGNLNIVGDGYLMAMAVGAKDFMPHSAGAGIYQIPAFPNVIYNQPFHPLSGLFGVASGGPVLWVNENAVRFANEGLRTENLVIQAVPGKTNRANFVIFDQNIFDTFFGTSDDARNMFEASLVTNQGNSIFRENSIEGMARRFNLDPATLRATIERYNRFVAQGADEDFGKPERFLVPIAQPPFYIAQLRMDFLFSAGGIWTNGNNQVLDNNRNPIPGLYAIGMDGTMLYRNVYTINMPGTAIAEAIHSGRRVANHLRDYLR